MIGEPRERRRYSAVMPESAYKRGREPRQRRRRRAAFADLAAGVERYLRREEVPGERADWAAWALRLAAGIRHADAPDQSRWFVRVHIE